MNLGYEISVLLVIYWNVSKSAILYQPYAMNLQNLRQWRELWWFPTENSSWMKSYECVGQTGLPWSPQDAGVSGGSNGAVDRGSGARQEPK